MYSSLEGLKSVFFSLYHLSLLHSHRKQTTSAPSCRVLLFVLDQGPRAKSACPFVTFYPWCTLMILSLTVWTIVCSSSDLTQMCHVSECVHVQMCMCVRSSQVTAGKSDPLTASGAREPLYKVEVATYVLLLCPLMQFAEVSVCSF